MEAYTAFAKVYDKFMENTPYDRWTEFIDATIRKFGITKKGRDAQDCLEQERNLVLDMGCGTGVLTRMMYDCGYDMIGVDISQEMLDEAYSKNTGEKEYDIMYICQDMCELDLFSTVGTVISTCDSINYLLDDMEVMDCFKGVENYLYPDGIFIFDFNTAYKYREVIGDRTIAENNEKCSFIWDNYYNEDNNINEYDLTLFIKDEETGLYERDIETHYQRGYEISEIETFLENASFEILGFIDEDTLGDYSDDDIMDQIENANDKCVNISDETERVIVIARKR